MTITNDDVAQIVEAVNEIIGQRLQPVYESIEQMREEFTQTVTVLDGNDTALLGEIRKMSGMTPAEVLKEAGESWERYVKSEAANLGLRIVAPKKKAAELDVEVAES